LDEIFPAQRPGVPLGTAAVASAAALAAKGNLPCASRAGFAEQRGTLAPLLRAGFIRVAGTSLTAAGLGLLSALLSARLLSLRILL
jgi:hypothetical protein